MGYGPPHSAVRNTLKKKKFERLIFPTQYVIPKNLKFGHWLSEVISCYFQEGSAPKKKTAAKSIAAEKTSPLQHPTRNPPASSCLHLKQLRGNRGWVKTLW